MFIEYDRILIEKFLYQIENNNLFDEKTLEKINNIPNKSFKEFNFKRFIGICKIKIEQKIFSIEEVCQFSEKFFNALGKMTDDIVFFDINKIIRLYFLYGEELNENNIKNFIDDLKKFFKEGSKKSKILLSYYGLTLMLKNDICSIDKEFTYVLIDFLDNLEDKDNIYPSILLKFFSI